MTYYDTIPLQNSGMLSAHRFTPPINKKTVYFQLPTDQVSVTDIYLQIDNQFQTKAFRNNGPMSTSVSLFEAVLPKAHDAIAILVSRAAVPMEGIHPKISNVTLSCNGFLVTARFQSTLCATFRCCDTCCLAKDWLAGSFRNPEATIRGALERHFSAAADSILSLQLRGGCLRPETIGNDLAVLREQIQKKALCDFMQEFPWAAVSQESFSLELINEDEILQPANDEARRLINARVRVFEAIVAGLGKPLLTPELTQLLQTYLNSRSELPDAEGILNFVNEIRPILQDGRPRLVESVIAQELGLQGIEEGFSYESVL